MRNSVLKTIAMLTYHGSPRELVFSIVNLLVMFLAPVGAPSSDAYKAMLTLRSTFLRRIERAQLLDAAVR